MERIAHHLIAAERERQVALGYDAEHDAKRPFGQLAAAASLILAELTVDVLGSTEHDLDWMHRLASHVKTKYADDVRLLVIAGALIAAEIDRRSAE